MSAQNAELWPRPVLGYGLRKEPFLCDLTTSNVPPIYLCIFYKIIEIFHLKIKINIDIPSSLHTHLLYLYITNISMWKSKIFYGCNQLTKFLNEMNFGPNDFKIVADNHIIYIFYRVVMEPNF